MEETHGVGVVQRLEQAIRRRSVLGLLAGIPLGIAFSADAGEAAKKKRKRKLFCLNGAQVKAKNKKKKRRLRRQGATRGQCPNATCPAGQILVNKVCTPCTVSCTGSATACGTALQNALQAGGTVYACPGEYQGDFAASVDVQLIGAGDGTDPASNTILRGTGATNVVRVAAGLTVTLDSVNITGGNATALPYFNGGGILTDTGVTLTVKNATVGGNTALYGGGISTGGALNLVDSTVSGNTCTQTGCGIHIYNSSPQRGVITNSSITGNTGPAAVEGGGLYIEAGAKMDVVGSEISGNTAGTGSAVYGVSDPSGTEVTIDSASKVTGNTAIGTAPVYAIDTFTNVGTVTITVAAGATVSGNTPATQCGPGVTGC